MSADLEKTHERIEKIEDIQHDVKLLEYKVNLLMAGTAVVGTLIIGYIVAALWQNAIAPHPSRPAPEKHTVPDKPAVVGQLLS